MGKLQNHKNGTEPNNSSVIIRVNPDNSRPVQGNPFVKIDELSRYYAYGIRNSFGIDFVKLGFNSGWAKPCDQSVEII